MIPRGFIGLAAFLPTVCATVSPQPLQQQWSRKVYGPDGPWNAVTVNVNGTPVDLTPGGYFQSWILSDKFCNNASLFNGHPCNTAGLISGPSGNPPTPEAHAPAVWVSGQPGGGPPSSVYAYTINLPGSDPQEVDQVAVSLVDSSWLILPDGTTYPETLGTLAIGAPQPNWSFQTGNYSFIPTALFMNGITPSSSVGIHIGSVTMNVPPSMYWGAYDRTRVLGDVLVQGARQAGTNLPTTGVGLRDIEIGTAVGGSPFSFASKSGLLAEGNSSMPERLLVEFFTNSPYIYLPQSTCDAIALNLPVTFQPKYGLYFWNTKDPNYSRIIKSASYLAFTFEADNLPSGNLTIKVPWSLLNLTLDSPIVDTPTPYFPCRPGGAEDNGAHVLGQAFMQAAFLAIDWHPSLPPGNFFLAQAPGPGVSSVPDETAIQDGAKNISASQVKWEDTWSKAWTPLPVGSNSPGSNSSSNSGPQPSQSSAAQPGLGSGAQAGIGVGVAAVGLAAIAAAFLFYRNRKRRAAANATAGTMSYPGMLGQNQRELDGAPPAYAKKPSSPQEMQDRSHSPQELHNTGPETRSPQIFELYDERPVRERGVAM